MIFRPVIAFALLFWLVAPGAAQDTSALVICKAIIDHAADLTRTGELEKARTMKPQLEKCLKVQREEMDRASREIVRRHNEDRAAAAKTEQPK